LLYTIILELLNYNVKIINAVPLYIQNYIMPG